MKDSEKATFYERLRKGLEESIAYSRGELSLVTTELPDPPPRARSKDIFQLRRRLKMSQAVFAATLNVSTKTVQSWEQGARRPSDAALRMLQVIDCQPEVVGMILSRKRVSSRRSARRPGRHEGSKTTG